MKFMLLLMVGIWELLFQFLFSSHTGSIFLGHLFQQSRKYVSLNCPFSSPDGHEGDGDENDDSKHIITNLPGIPFARSWAKIFLKLIFLYLHSHSQNMRYHLLQLRIGTKYFYVIFIRPYVK